MFFIGSYLGYICFFKLFTGLALSFNANPVLSSAVKSTEMLLSEVWSALRVPLCLRDLELVVFFLWLFSVLEAIFCVAFYCFG